MSALENELSRLRPLLAMQATVLRDSELWRSESISDVIPAQLSTYSKKAKGKERALPSTDTTSINGHVEKDQDSVQHVDFF